VADVRSKARAILSPMQECHAASGLFHKIVTAWLTLPEAIRRAMLALIGLPKRHRATSASRSRLHSRRFAQMSAGRIEFDYPSPLVIFIVSTYAHLYRLKIPRPRGNGRKSELAFGTRLA
jgi:hypothetical protein